MLSPKLSPIKLAKVSDISDVDDTAVDRITPMLPPACLIEDFPLSPAAHLTVKEGRLMSRSILNGEDDRVMAIVGPCSIHDVELGLDYAKRLKSLSDRIQKDVFVVMRVYFEKPRTTIGWKGLINDPYLDDSYLVNHGLRLARKLLLDINELGLPCGGEYLDTITPQFLADLFCWGAIGARTSESQLHRELASGMSMPVGFKNGTNGSVDIAIDACTASRYPHHFLGLTKQGLAAVVHTKGNPNCHVILRGSTEGPNYTEPHITSLSQKLSAKKLPVRVVVDCSHGNSRKDYKNQGPVLEDLCNQISSGSNAIVGVMLESNIIEGRQDLIKGKPLVYGQSITDACINWETTETLLLKLSDAVRERRKKLSNGHS